MVIIVIIQCAYLNWNIIQNISYIYMLKEKLVSLKDGDSNVYDHLVNVMKQIIVNNDR